MLYPKNNKQIGLAAGDACTVALLISLVLVLKVYDWGEIWVCKIGGCWLVSFGSSSWRLWIHQRLMILLGIRDSLPSVYRAIRASSCWGDNLVLALLLVGINSREDCKIQNGFKNFGATSSLSPKSKCDYILITLILIWCGYIVFLVDQGKWGSFYFFVVFTF